MRARVFLTLVAAAAVTVTACGDELEPTSVEEPDIFFEIWPTGQPIGDTLDITVFSEVDVQLRLMRGGEELLGAKATWESLDPDLLDVQPAQVSRGADSLASLMRARLTGKAYSFGSLASLFITIEHPGIEDVSGIQLVEVTDLVTALSWPTSVGVDSMFELEIPVSGTGVGQTDTVFADWSVSPSDRAEILYTGFDSAAQVLFAGVETRRRGKVEFFAEVKQPGSNDFLWVWDTVLVEERWSTVEAGAGHSCAVASDDLAYCWGFELGNGRTGNFTQPKEVLLPAEVEVISLSMPPAGIINPPNATAMSTCATTEDGPAYCWGDNSVGKLGTRDELDRFFPAEVVIHQAAPPVSIANGIWHSCAVAGDIQSRPDDTWAVCWGRANAGHLGFGPDSTAATTTICVAPGLGPGTVECRLTPQTVLTSNNVRLRGLQTVSVGQAFACGLHFDGRAWCWGQRDQGATGETGAGPTQFAIPVTGGDLATATLVSVDSGGNQTCAVTDRGAVYCWGNPPGPGPIDPTPALRIDASFGGISVSVGLDHACAVNDTGEVRCWGMNFFGQLGDGTNTDEHDTPQVVQGGLQFAMVSAGFQRTCGVTLHGAMYCWGKNEVSGIGLAGNTSDTTGHENVPIRVDDPEES